MDITAAEALALWETHKTEVIDVRTIEEFAEGHIPGAVNIPLNQLTEKMNLIPKDKSVLVVCRSGRRSAIAVKFLLDQGFNNVVNVSGGMLAWQGKTETTY